MEIPNFITHYYLADRQPFLTLSELKNGQDSSIFQRIIVRLLHECLLPLAFEITQINFAQVL
jgi:hypothetical protein